ncbi:MAG TPA: LysM peptidoglycan-binding domain-containing protein, partial [Gemmatimonadales bacterium]
MRRTTICRSSQVALAVVVALPLAAATIAAQDVTTAAQSQGTHVVSRGETLWSISQQYFADPLLWPEIYRRNTAVIEDPHWIYPGEVLELSGLMAPTDTTPTIAEGGPADTAQALFEPPPEPEGPET